MDILNVGCQPIAMQYRKKIPTVTAEFSSHQQIEVGTTGEDESWCETYLRFENTDARYAVQVNMLPHGFELKIKTAEGADQLAASLEWAAQVLFKQMNGKLEHVVTEQPEKSQWYTSKCTEYTTPDLKRVYPLVIHEDQIKQQVMGIKHLTALNVYDTQEAAQAALIRDFKQSVPQGAGYYFNNTHGVSKKIHDVKLYDSDSSWKERMYCASTSNSPIWICTYSLPRWKEIPNILGQRVTERKCQGVTLICNPTANSVIERAYTLKQQYPAMRIVLHNKIHAKMVLVGNTSFLSTENFGSNTGWFERTVGIHDQQIHDKNLNDLVSFLRSSPGIELEINKPIEFYKRWFKVTYPVASAAAG